MKIYSVIQGSGSSGSGNSFVTIQTDAGTFPVASGSDTLVITSSDASITVTGNSGTKTVDLVVAGGGYNRIQEEGTTLTARNVLNFVGTAITAADSSSPARTVVTLAQTPTGSTQVVGGGRNVTPVFPLLGGGNLYTDVTLSIPVATGSTGGYLAAADFTTFNAKVSATRSVGTTYPLFGGGDLSADRVLGINPATGLTAGFVSNAGQTFSGLKTFGDGITTFNRNIYTPSTLGFTTSITIDAATTNFVEVGAVTANTTVNAPTNPTDAQWLAFRFTQGTTGGFGVSFASVFVTNESIPSLVNSSLPNKVDMYLFRYSSGATLWRAAAFTKGSA